jgi:hypothetical protein
LFEERIMDGFIIGREVIVVKGIETGYFLDRNGEWRKKPANQAYVFSAEEKEKILKQAKTEKWTLMPQWIIPAEYNKNTDATIVTGKVSAAYPAEA